jgi:AcrR family transcriptional regulator
LKKRRAYDTTLRAQKAAESEAKVLAAARRLFDTRPFDRVSLAEVAEAAGVTIPTLQRRFGNKEGLIAAGAAAFVMEAASQRAAPPFGDVKACLREVVDHYERDGATLWQYLRQENDVPIFGVFLAGGRAQHRQWVELVFAEAIARVAGRKRRALVDSLVAVTDVFVWKLLRIDLGRTRAEVEAIITAMAEAIVASA